MQLESTAKYSEYYYSLDDSHTAKQRYKVKLELVGALEDPYVAYERDIVSVDWNNWPQVPIAVAKTLQHPFFLSHPTSFFSPPKFCEICSYHAHASSSKGSSCARIRKKHNQGIGGCCSFPPKRSVRYIFTSTHLESNLCAPLLLSTGTYVLYLEENDKNERPNL